MASARPAGPRADPGGPPRRRDRLCGQDHRRSCGVLCLIVVGRSRGGR